MCGIFGYVGTKTNAAQIVLEGLKALEYRGYDSWGVAAVPAENSKARHESKIIIKKRTGKIGNADVLDFPPSTIAFGHTRWATHGGVTEINAHPHLDCTGNLAVIHNGIIENYIELKKKLLKDGHKFVSQTDTEVAAHLVEGLAKPTMLSKAVQKAFNQMDGLNALIYLSSNEHKLVAVRNGSPLVVGFGSGENFLASDATAILPYTKQVHFLEDDEMAIVSEKAIMIFNAKSGKFVHPNKQTLDWDISKVEKGKFAHYMLKEIYDQPGVITDIAVESSAQATRLTKEIKQAYDTYMVACGTASYACLAGAYLFSKISKRHVNWAIASEFGYQLDFLKPGSLVIALSQSGETMDTLIAVRKAKSRGAKIIGLVNSLGSTLYREADYKMLIGAGPEKAVASTKAFTAKLAHLVMLAYALTGDSAAGTRVLMQAAKASKTVLSPKNIKRIRSLATMIAKRQHVYVIGRGLSYPASLETALKIKEISYIHAEGLAAGELKHGPLALVEKGTPCIVFLPHDETYQASLAAAQELKARGGYVIGLSPKPHEVFDYFLPVPDAQEASIIPGVITAQLLAYYLTLERKFDPDKPRNLAKSVTVK